MRRLSAATLVALLATTVFTTAQSPSSVPVTDTETTGQWFVELASPPTIDGTAQSILDREEADFDRDAAANGVRYQKGRSFKKLWNGVTIGASLADIGRVKALPGVRAVYPVTRVDLAQSETGGGSIPDLLTALSMTGADIAQNSLGLTGKGVTVAVIDTGIDYDHPDLGGCFGPGCRVEKGYDFVGDTFNFDSTSASYQPIPHPDLLPDDCNGHGTHVSGIVGANGGLKGVAPEVTFHAYRVFGCVGSTSAAVMLAAMEQALDDKADVVNMSIGAALQWPQYPTAAGATRLVKQGVVVVTSTGNEGALGLYAASAPGVGHDVIAVASFDNIAANLNAFSISPDNTLVGYIEATGAPAPPKSGSMPMTRTGTTSSAADACNPLPANSLSGFVALIRRGTCSFYVKAFNAQAAGAIGVVLYNNAAGFISPTVVGTPPITIPVVSITAAKGALINGRLASGPVTMTWTATVASEPQPTGNLISSFSSYGPAADLTLKPDIGAPGGTIRSTLPLELGGYGNLSGTSMASPHVAGSVALLLQSQPQLRPDDVRERLQNNARPQLWSGGPQFGLLDIVHRQGAGMLRIDDAILAETVVTPSKLSLGEIESGAAFATLRIQRKGGNHGHNKNANPVTYTLGAETAIVTGANTFAPQFYAAPADVAFSKSAVTLNGPGGAANVNVSITPFPDPAVRVFGGYITLTPDDGGPVLRVPFAGYNGDYQAIPVLTPTPLNLPWLAKLVGPSLVNQPNGATYTLVGNDVPFFVVHFDHQVQLLKMEVIESATNRSFDFADIEEFLPRNSSATSFFAVTWDGTAIKKIGKKVRVVPNGAYRIELSVVKALGNESNPAHVEKWVSPTIVIARP